MRVFEKLGHDSLYLRGALLVLGAGATWSIAGIMIRNIDDASGWQILFYRSLGFTATILVVLIHRTQGRVPAAIRAAGPIGVVGGLCLAFAFITNIFSLLNTSVASAVFMQSTQVFFGAVLGWLFLREEVRPAAWLAMVGALAGVALMLGDGIADGTLFGNLLALLTGLGVAGLAVSLRWGHAVDMLPAVLFGGIFTAIGSGLLADSMIVSQHDLILALAMGVIQIGIGFIAFTAGSRHVPAAELTLLALSEVVFAPVWVWIGIGEVPSALTLAGGAILIGTVVALVLAGARRPPAPACRKLG
jgi:drug/metabolite transporter (DMT)-like permease